MTIDSNRRWLGWAAIGLGVLLLLGMLGGHGRHGGWHGFRSEGAHGPRGSAYQGPQMPGAPGLGSQPGAIAGDYARGYEDGLRAARGFEGARHGGPPFFFLGGLFKLLFVGLLVLFALKALGRWRGPGGPGWHQHHQQQPPPPQQPQQPDPEKPPYTGETRTL